MGQVHIDRLYPADAEKVWQILSDFEATSIPNLKVNVLEPGNRNKNNTGLIREISLNGNKIREKILSVTPGESIEYQIISGAPVHDYFGTIFIYPEREGTTVRWVATFKTSFPWPEWIIKKRAIKMISKIMDEIGKAIGESVA